jgi:hypothetical protein
MFFGGSESLSSTMGWKSVLAVNVVDTPRDLFYHQSNDDLVVTNQDGSIAIFRNNGDGTFTLTAPAWYLSGLNIKSIFSFVPVNDLGFKISNLAVVVENFNDPYFPNNSGGISILTINGDGTFGYSPYYAGLRNPQSVLAADFDKDGDSDLALISGNNVSIFKSTIRTKPITYTINATTSTGGSISPYGALEVNYGSNQTFTITPLTGYKIDYVLVDGVSAGSVSSYTFSNISTNHSISANFKPITYTITATTNLGGSISPSGAVVVNHGTNKTFTFTPSTGYKIDYVLIDGVSAGAVSSYTFTNITTNHTVDAHFALKPCDGTTTGTGYYLTGSYKTQVSITADSTNLPAGKLTYYNSRNRVSLASTSITSVELPSSDVAVIKGTGNVNLIPGYTFTATITNGIPDKWEMKIYDSTSALFESGSGSLSRGDLVVTTAAGCAF